MGQRHVGLGDAADALLQQLDLHLGMLELGELLLDRFDRAAHVGPQDDVERLHFAGVLEPIEQVFERDVPEAGCAERRSAALARRATRAISRALAMSSST